MDVDLLLWGMTAQKVGTSGRLRLIAQKLLELTRNWDILLGEPGRALVGRPARYHFVLDISCRSIR